MSRLVPPPIGAEQQVTASDLVRHFGIWQERAARAPVYILHRNRPRLVLTSVDVMDALCGAHATSDESPRFAGLLDAIDSVMVITDRDGTITHASRGARARYGEFVASGAAVDAFASIGGELLGDAVQRVAGSGISETVEVLQSRYIGRRLSCLIEPFPNGCVVTARDLTAAEQMRAGEERRRAVCAAIESAGVIVVRVGPRGYLETASEQLSEMTGIASETLMTARLVTLFEVGDRVVAGEAIERSFAGEAQPPIAANLIVRGAAARPVTVSFAPLLDGGRPVAAIAAIMPRANAA